MIIYKQGSLFDSSADVYVNAVNCVGVMSKGIALEFKNRYPKMYEWYREECLARRVTIGKIQCWFSCVFILNFPTKNHWRDKSKLEDIEAGLQDFVDWANTYGFRSVAFPKLGCGNGGLDWQDVKPLMEKYLEPLACVCEIYV
jgi:O-acetyl-ADP-ribose deacetylase (regulator of RNase III)